MKNALAWLKLHKVATSSIAVVVALILAAGSVVMLATPSSGDSGVEPALESTEQDWGAARAELDTALIEYETAVAQAEEARTAALASHNQLRVVIAMAAAAKIEVTELATIDAQMADALASPIGTVKGESVNSLDISEVPAEAPQPVSVDDAEYANFTQHVNDDIRQISEATATAHAKTKEIEQFIDDVSGEQLGAAYLAIAPAVIAHGETSQVDVSSLRDAVDQQTVTAKNIIDVFTMIAVATSTSPVSEPKPETKPTPPKAPSTPAPGKPENETPPVSPTPLPTPTPVPPTPTPPPTTPPPSENPEPTPEPTTPQPEPSLSTPTPATPL